MELIPGRSCRRWHVLALMGVITWFVAHASRSDSPAVTRGLPREGLISFLMGDAFKAHALPDGGRDLFNIRRLQLTRERRLPVLDGTFGDIAQYRLVSLPEGGRDIVELRHFLVGRGLRKSESSTSRKPIVPVISESKPKARPIDEHSASAKAATNPDDRSQNSSIPQARFVTVDSRPKRLPDIPVIVVQDAKRPALLEGIRIGDPVKAPTEALPLRTVRADADGSPPLQNTDAVINRLQVGRSRLGPFGSRGMMPETIEVTVGLHKVLIANSTVLRIAISNPTVIDAVPISTRHIIINGLAPGLSSLSVMEERFAGDRIGILHEYLVKVVTETVVTPVVEPMRPQKSLEQLEREIREAIGNENIVIRVFRDKENRTFATLRGTVEKQREADFISQTAASFVDTVQAIIEVTEQPMVAPPPLTEDDRLTHELREETQLPDIKARRVMSGAETSIVLFGEVRTKEEAMIAVRAARARGPVTNLLRLTGEGDAQATERRSPFVDISDVELSPQDQAITSDIRSITKLNEVIVRQRGRMFYLNGRVKSQQDVMNLERALQDYVASGQAGGPSGAAAAAAAAGGTGEVINIRNFLEIEEGGMVRQVNILARIVEISRTATRNLGIQWGGTPPGQGGGNIGGSTPQTGAPSPVFGRLTFGQLTPRGPFTRIDPLLLQLNMLASESRARILSEPNETTLDRSPAWIQVGGSFPIVVTTLGGGAGGFATQTVEFVQFGIMLVIRPETTDDGHILLQVQAVVSQPDFGVSVTFQGARIPGLRSRAAQTSLILSPGESVAIGGLIDRQDSKTVTRIPLLSSIPIIGELFKSRDFQRGDTELIIFLTPQVEEIPASTGAMDRAIRTPGLPPLPPPNPLGTIGQRSTTGASPIQGGGG